METTIRSMNITDFDTVLELWQLTEGVGLNESDTREKIALFLERNPGLSFVAIDQDSRIVGAILGGHDGRRGYLHHLAVAQVHRGHGLGRRLVESCLTVLGEQHILKCNIFVFGNNAEGQAFWKHLGWNPREGLLVMQKTIIE